MKKHYFLTLCLALLGLRAEAYDFSAASEGQFPIDLYYAVNPDGTTVTLVQGPATYRCTALDIPATVEHEGKTYTVTTIGAQAFRLADIGPFEMPNTVTTIQDAAFQGCVGTPESFPASLEFIGVSAFQGAHVVEAVLPEGLRHIGQEAFAGTYNNITPGTLRRVVLPSTLTEMGDYAFEYQRSHPQKSNQLHSFLSYYLPTTLKILRAYAQLEDQEVDGENISAAMERIEGMMDKVVEGFEKQLDQLFQGDALDITADVEVLERMLAKDGLSSGSTLRMLNSSRWSSLTPR